MGNNDTIHEKEWITLAEAARIVGVSESNILELLDARQVRTRLRKNTTLFNRNTLLAAHRQSSAIASSVFPSQLALAMIEGRSETEQHQRNAAAVQLLTDWTQATGDEATDQSETLLYLLEHFDEEHSNREIFSDEVKQQLHQILASHE